MTNLKHRLSADHDELERQLHVPGRAVDANNAACDLQACWACCENSLREHS